MGPLYKLMNKIKRIEINVHNDYTFARNNELSRCSKNLESLFITITNTPMPITIGNVYRPPSGSIKDFF